MTSEPRGSVLVVEDEDIVRDLIVHVLQRGGYQVSAAVNGCDALEILEGRAIDLILSDLRMPVMGGLALLREARAHYPDVDIIMLTAYGTIDSAVEALKLGALDYLAKPFDINELLERVALSFERRRERIAARQAPTMPLLELNRIISRPADPKAILGDILALAKTTFSADLVHVELLNGWGHHDLGSEGWQPGSAHEAPMQVSAQQIRSLAQEPSPWLFGDSGRPLNAPERLTQGHCIVVPIAANAEAIGALQVARAARSPRYTEIDAQLLHLFGAQLALAILHGEAQRQLHKTFSDLQELSISAAEALAEALGTFDENTRGHSQRVSRYARSLAQSVGLSDHECDVIEIAGLLHDIGKLGVGETTLRKNGQLTDSEQDRIRLHPAQGARILSGLDALAEVVPIVRHHHERFDGGGYPEGLCGDQIPFGARLLAIVDAYDSMVTDRPYRKALSEQEAQRRIRHAAGTQFDPSLVDAWLQSTQERLATIAELAWETHA